MNDELVIRKFADGEIIFRQDSAAEEMYVVRSGSVRVFRERGGKETTLATLGQGEFLGEMAMLTHARRAATAQAMGATEVRVMSNAELERVVSDPVARDLLRTLVTRLRDMDEAVEKASAESSAVREGLSRIQIVRHWYT